MLRNYERVEFVLYGPDAEQLMKICTSGKGCSKYSVAKRAMLDFLAEMTRKEKEEKKQDEYEQRRIRDPPRKAVEITR